MGLQNPPEGSAQVAPSREGVLAQADPTRAEASNVDAPLEGFGAWRAGLPLSFPEERDALRVL